MMTDVMVDRDYVHNIIALTVSTHNKIRYFKTRTNRGILN